MWWAAFFAFVAGPLLAISIEMGRYARAASEVQKASDMAALAAVREVDVPYFVKTGQLKFKGTAPAVAQAFASANAEYLAGKGIAVSVVGLRVSNARRTVYVACRADVSRLFPKWVPAVVIQREGTAQARFTMY